MQAIDAIKHEVPLVGIHLRHVLHFLMMGGLSLVAYAVIVVFQITTESFDVVWWMWVLAFFVNGPHFIVSYQMFYRGGKAAVGGKRFLWAGLVVPTVLGMALLVGMIGEFHQLFVALLYGMFFLVGWHYIKQTYGCFIVYGGFSGIRLGKLEQGLIKWSLFPLWLLSFANMFSVGGGKDYYGLLYVAPTIDPVLLNLLYLLTCFGAAIPVIVLLRRKLLGMSGPGVIACMPLVSIYIWLVPALFNPVFYFMVPFFHSLQYLLFSGQYTISKAKVSKDGSCSEMLRWWGGSFAIAALAFYLIPEWLDRSVDLSIGQSSQIFMISFLLFINIHHYFIDSVMWRGDNLEIRNNVRF